MIRMIISSVLGMLFILAPVQSFASTYIGDFCWVMSHPDGVNRYYKLGLSNVGGGHFSVHGLWLHGDGIEKSPIYGSADRINGVLEFSLQRTDSDPTFTHFRASHFDLGPNLNGTVRWVRINRDASVATNEAPVTYISCTALP